MLDAVSLDGGGATVNNEPWEAGVLHEGTEGGLLENERAVVGVHGSLVQGRERNKESANRLSVDQLAGGRVLGVSAEVYAGGTSSGYTV